MNPRVLELNINIFDISICKETRAHARATRRETRVPSGGISFIICLFFILFFFSLSRWLTQTFSILVPLPASESERERERGGSWFSGIRGSSPWCQGTNILPDWNELCEPSESWRDDDEIQRYYVVLLSECWADLSSKGKHANFAGTLFAPRGTVIHHHDTPWLPGLLVYLLAFPLMCLCMPFDIHLTSHKNRIWVWIYNFWEKYHKCACVHRYNYERTK